MKQNLDDFLKAPTPVLRATLEPSSDPDSIRVTPWLGDGCGCGTALVVPKSAIAFVTPAGGQHICCGKLLQVVDVEFSAEGRLLHSVFTQLISERARSRDTRDGDECQHECGHVYQSCLEGCDPDDEACRYACKQALQRCLKKCSPPPSAPPEDIPTESCRVRFELTFLGVPLTPVALDLSNTLHLSGPAGVRDATIDPFRVVLEATTQFSPGRGRYVRSSGIIEIPGTAEIRFKDAKEVINVFMTTEAVASPSGHFRATGSRLDRPSRTFQLVAAGGVGFIEYLLSVTATLSRTPA